VLATLKKYRQEDITNLFSGKENASPAQRSSQGDPTRVWLMVLTLSWIIVMISTIAFEVFGFQPLKKAPSEGQGDGTPPDPAMLDELTSAYMQERYGGKHPRLQRDAYVSAWIPRFVRRLAESNKQRNDTFTTT